MKRRIGVHSSLVLSVTLVLALAMAWPARATVLGWTPTGRMAEARSIHTATLLPNGRVLVVGGSRSGHDLASAEIYRPTPGTWIRTGSMAEGRSSHTATLLPNGRVLVVGGHNGNVGALASAEIYDPASGTWAPTGSMATARWGHTATLLLDGRVLVAGGYNVLNGHSNYLASAEIYDPASGTWAPTGSMATARAGRSTAVRLLDGRVLVAGGSNELNGELNPLASAEIYDPASGTWAPTGSMAAARSGHTVIRLRDGRVLAAGGYNLGGLATAEVYDPASGTWAPTGSMAAARFNHTATRLADGRVLVAGGGSASAEVYDPASGTWAPAGSMARVVYNHTATRLADGRVLVAGGSSGGQVLPGAAIYAPG